MSIQIRGSSGNIADVDSSNQLKVVLPTTASAAGYAALVGEISAADEPAGRVVVPAEVSRDNRLRVGVDQLLWQFNSDGDADATHMLYQSVSGMSCAMNAGYIAINTTTSVTSSNYGAYISYRGFALTPTYSTIFETRARPVNGSVADAAIEFGLGAIPASSAAPVDGVFFRFGTTGAFVGVVSNGGTETTTGTLTSPTDAVYHTFRFVIYSDKVDFFVDEELQGTVTIPNTQSALTAAATAPFFARVRNTGTPSSAKELRIGYVTVSSGDMYTGRPWSHVMAGMHMGAYNTIPSDTVGQTANYANSAAPATAATFSNTAAAYSTLGGQWRSPTTWPASAETDYLVFSYSTPAFNPGTTTGRNLIITGIRVGETFVTTILTGGPLVLQWFASSGATAASLATTDSTTTVSHKRIALGSQSLAATAAVGTLSPGFFIPLTDGPLVAQPGTRISVGLKMLGTTVTAGVIRGTVTLIGYWE